MMKNIDWFEIELIILFRILPWALVIITIGLVIWDATK